MTIQRRLLLLSLLFSLGMGSSIAVFTLAIGSLDAIEREKAALVSLADAVRNLSIAVNSLDSNQYRNQAKRLDAAVERAEATFAEVPRLVTLAGLSPELAEAVEIIGNMHALITDDLASLVERYRALQADLELVFLESNSTTPRQFYTDERARLRPDIGPIHQRLDELITGINGLTETLAGVTDTVAGQTQVIVDETNRVRGQSLGFATLFSVVVLLGIAVPSLLAGRAISRGVRSMQVGLVAMAEGDFTPVFRTNGRDEVSQIGTSVNTLLASLNRLLGQIQDELGRLGSGSAQLTTEMGEAISAASIIQASLARTSSSLNDETQTIRHLEGATQELASAVQNLDQTYDAQRKTLEESLSLVEAMTGGLREISRGTESAERSARQLGLVSGEGRVKLDLVARSVAQIAAASQNLAQISEVIGDLSARTNLLAMNASIEAAHAGVSGRGFGVVAHEIRSLAEQAAVQSGRISQDLTGVQAHIAAIEAATEEALRVFGQISSEIEVVIDSVHQARSRVEGEAARGEVAGDGIQRLRRSNHDLNDAVGRLRVVGEGVSDTAGQLLGHNAVLQQNNEEVLHQTTTIVDLVRRIGELATATNGQVDVLVGETERFRITR